MSCTICGDTALIPFVKEGRVIPNTFQDCSCKVSEVEHYRPIQAEDFDFPCSETFKAHSYQYYNQVDPAEQPETVREVVREIIPQRIIVKHHYIAPQFKKQYEEYK